jgi:hypothetical protein
MYIGSQPSDRTSGAKPRDEFVGDGSTVNFTLSQEVPGGFESNVLVIVDNVLQQPVESYTIAGDNITLAFSEAPASGTIIYVLHQGTATYQMIPVVGSVTPDKLSENLRNFTVDTFTGNGSTTAYTLTAEPASANSILVIVDGIVQTRTTNYSLSGTTLTFASAPDNSSSITVIHLGFSTVSRTAVPDGSITTAKIADNAITSAKIAFDVIVAEDIAAKSNTVSELQNGAVTPAKVSTGGPSWDTSGNLGIGTASPGTKLDVVGGTIRSSISGGTPIFYLNNGTTQHSIRNTSDALTFFNDAEERMRITVAGNVGIGITNPAYQLQLSGGTTVTSRVQLNRGSDDTNQNLRVGWNSIKTTRLNVPVAGTNLTNLDFIQVGSDGEKTCFSMATNGSLEVNYGIKFPASQSASSDANTLDDYEEGTFTASAIPSVSGSITFDGDNTCFYTKVGRIVTVSGRLDVQSVSSPNGELRVTLPFTVSNSGQTASSSCSCFIWNSSAGAAGLWVSWIDPNAAFAYFRYGDVSTPGGNAAQYMQNGSEIRFNITYVAA